MFADSDRTQASTGYSSDLSLINCAQEHNIKNTWNSGYFLFKILLFIYLPKNTYMTLALELTKFKRSL